MFLATRRMLKIALRYYQLYFKIGLPDIFFYCAVEQNRLLSNNAYLVSEPTNVVVFHVPAIQMYLPTVGIIKPLNQLNTRGFPTTRWTHERHSLSALNLQVKALEYLHVSSCRIVEVDVFEGYAAG